MSKYNTTHVYGTLTLTFEVLQDFVGFFKLQRLMSLVKDPEDNLLQSSLSLNDCGGQCYIGVSNMAGRISGMQAQIRQKCDKALYTALRILRGATRCFMRPARLGERP